MQHFTDDFCTVNATDTRHRVEYGVGLDGDLGPKVSKFLCHLGGPNIGAQGGQGYFAFRDLVQFLRKIGAGFAMLADNLADVDPLRASSFSDRLTFT